MKIAKLLCATAAAAVLFSTLAVVPAQAKRPVNPQLKAAQKRAKAQRKAQRRLAKQMKEHQKAVRH